MTDATKSKMIYVSPAYEKIWGRTRAQLYQSPWDWLEAVHADDRERIRKAATSKQLAGTYDEEFRVVRPDGSVRWIRDRAFPVFDKDGKAYRLAGIAEDITERKRLEQEVVEISDREQERIGQDLHDGLCQHLASIAMTASLLKRRLTGVSNPEARIAERICTQLEDAIMQARGVARGVSSLDLGEDNLSPALEALATATSKEYGISCQVDFSEPISFGDPEVVTNVYRIAREAVYNAAKHAHPSQILIELKAQADTVCLKVTDDGVGIDSTPRNGMGLGLGMMRYRASLMGAELKIERAGSGGTVMTCNLPRNPL
jgi:PAS domain S-box-containing protein